MTTTIVDKDGKSISQGDVKSKPSNRYFRDAWTLSGKVISEDLVTAKIMFKDKIREVRKPLLEAQDVAYMKALESGSSSAQTTVKNEKTKLRDATDASAITNAKTIAELKSAWNTSLLGASPYA